MKLGSVIGKDLADWCQIMYEEKKLFFFYLPLVWIERGEAHEEESEDKEDEDQAPECVNHSHSQRDGQGTHIWTNIKVPKTGERGVICQSQLFGELWKVDVSIKKEFHVLWKWHFFIFVPGSSSQGVSMDPTIVIFSLHMALCSHRVMPTTFCQFSSTMDKKGEFRMNTKVSNDLVRIRQIHSSWIRSWFSLFRTNKQRTNRRGTVEKYGFCW